MGLDWPFDQVENVSALTTRQVLTEGYPVLTVVHYSDDHSWAFTCATTDDDTEDGMVVCMGHLVQMDPTLLSIADLKPGWVAVRDVVGGEWERYQDDEM